jgi:BioD-like phosphotransacetylase family protein
LPDEEVEKLLRAKPTGNIPTETAQRRIEDVLDQYGVLQDQIAEFVRKRAATLKEAHVRVRSALRESQRTEVLPELPADMVGIYVYLPDK